MNTDVTRIDERDLWAWKMETWTHECDACGEEFKLRVVDYVVGSLGGVPFDTIFYGGRCPRCGELNSQGQREVEDENALHLRDRWLQLITALQFKRDEADEQRQLRRENWLQLGEVSIGQMLRVNTRTTRWLRELYLVPRADGQMDIYQHGYTVTVLPLPESPRSSEELRRHILQTPLRDFAGE